MKIAFGMIILNGNYILEEVLTSVYPYATQILIAEGPVEYWQLQGLTSSDDGTNEILDNFPDPDNKIKIIHSRYKEKDEQCNAYIPFLRDDIDYLWNLDCDEIFKGPDIEKLIDILEKEKYTSVGFKSKTFYGGFDKVIGGFEENYEFLRIRKIYPGSYWSTHRPPTIAHKVSETLPEKHLNFNYLLNEYGIQMYHYSYVFPHQVYEKLDYYKAAVSKSNCINNYFENIYFPWVISDDLKRQQIEDYYNGVHEFINRESAKTKPFLEQQPDVILNNMDKLKEIFELQLKNLIKFNKKYKQFPRYREYIEIIKKGFNV